MKLTRWGHPGTKIKAIITGSLLVALLGTTPVSADHTADPAHWSDPVGATGWTWITIKDRTPAIYMGDIVKEEALAWMTGPGQGNSSWGIYIHWVREPESWGCNEEVGALVVCAYELGNWPPASTSHTGGHISRGRTMIDWNTVHYESMDRKRKVVRHELGHGLGFPHSSVGPMRENGDVYAFTQHDYDAFWLKYGHND